MTRQSVGIAVEKARGFVATRPDWFLDRIARLNMTNFRAITTIGLAIWTAHRYLTEPKWGTWEPSLEWLGFLLSLGGLDVLQFGIKRKTHREGGSDGTDPDSNGERSGRDVRPAPRDAEPDAAHARR